VVDARFWPLGKSKPSFKIEMVNLPIFGEAEGVPFPRFKIALSEESPDDFVAAVEQEAREIVGDIIDKEFLAQRSIVGSGMTIGDITEELGIHHMEHKISAKVLKSLEEKSKKVDAKNTTTAAESKKRRGASGPKAVSQK